MLNPHGKLFLFLLLNECQRGILKEKERGGGQERGGGGRGGGRGGHKGISFSLTLNGTIKIVPH